MCVTHEAREPTGGNVRSIDAKLLVDHPAPAWAEEHMREQQREIRRLSDENRTLREAIADNGTLIDKLRADGALVVHGLDIAMQLISSLIAWLPSGQLLPDNVSGLKLQLDEVWAKIRRRQAS